VAQNKGPSDSRPAQLETPAAKKYYGNQANLDKRIEHVRIQSKRVSNAQNFNMLKSFMEDETSTLINKLD
jgi:hypothetical protein